MEISSSACLTQTATCFASVTNRSEKELPVDGTSQTVPESETGKDAVAAAETPESGFEQKTKMKGVLRLLQEGHFKGVSDVRLRINFNEEITALENKQQAQAMDEGITGIAGALKNDIDALLASETLEEESTALITQAAELLYNNIKSASGDNPADLITDLQSQFDQFVSAVTPEPALETQSETGSITQNPKVISPESEPAIIPNINLEMGLSCTEESGDDTFSDCDIIEQFLASLAEMFTDQLNNLETVLDGLSVLPELSQPSGNGKAYDKFTAIYNKLKSAPEQSPQPDTVDASA